MKFTEGLPPKDTRRIYGWVDTPNTTADCAYIIKNAGRDATRIVVGKKRRRILEGLMRSPVYAASYVRISDHVDHLKRAGVEIETLMFKNDPDTGRDTYGVYRLVSQVSRATLEGRAAA